MRPSSFLFLVSIRRSLWLASNDYRDILIAIDDTWPRRLSTVLGEAPKQLPHTILPDTAHPQVVLIMFQDCNLTYVREIKRRLS